jgi:hypothetical protein
MQGPSSGGRTDSIYCSETPAAWPRAVPLHTPDELQPAIDRMARGEDNVLVAAPVRFFSRTSGTTGAGRLIPAPPRHQATFTRTYAGLVPAVPTLAVLRADDASAPGPRADQRGRDAAPHHPGASRSGSASTGGLRRGGTASPSGSGPRPGRCSRSRDVATQWYLHALFALRERSTAVPLGGVRAAPPRVAANARSLAVRPRPRPRRRRVSPTTSRSPRRSGRRSRPGCTPDPARGPARSRPAFAAGDPQLVRRLWPRLRYAAAVITGELRGVRAPAATGARATSRFIRPRATRPPRRSSGSTSRSTGRSATC